MTYINVPLTQLLGIIWGVFVAFALTETSSCAADIEISGVQNFSGNIENNNTITFSPTGGTMRIVGDTSINGNGDIALNGSNTSISWIYAGLGNQPYRLTNESNLIHGFGEFTGGTGILVNNHMIRADAGSFYVGPNITIDNAAGMVEVLSGSTLSVSGHIEGGAVRIGNGGIISNGFSRGKISNSTIRCEDNSILSGVTLQNSTIEGSTSLLGSPAGIEGVLENNGALLVLDAGGLEVRGNSTLKGTGEIILNNQTAGLNWDYPGVENEPFNLTNESNVIRGFGSFTGNLGTLTNNHIIRAEGGTLRLRRLFTIDNTGGVIEIAEDGILGGESNAKIVGGLITGAGTSVLSDVTLRDVTIEGDLMLISSSPGLGGAIKNNGRLTSTNQGGLDVRADSILDGTGEIILNVSNTWIHWEYAGHGNKPFTLTNESNLIRGVGHFTGNPGTLINRHIIRAEGGTLYIHSNLTFDNSEGILEVASDGILESESFGDGLIRGNGIIRGDVLLTGTVNPGMSFGSMTIEGDYSQNAAGVLQIEIGGLDLGSEYDHLVVEYDALLNGTLLFSFMDSFAPKTGDRFDFLQVDGALSGYWLDIQIENLLPGFKYDVVEHNGVYSLIALNDAIAVPEPSTAVLAGMAGLALVGRVVRRKHNRS